MQREHEHELQRQEARLQEMEVKMQQLVMAQPEAASEPVSETSHLHSSTRTAWTGYEPL